MPHVIHPRRHPLCPSCRYDLVVTVEEGGRTCPECGTAIPFMKPARAETAASVLDELGDRAIDDSVARRILPHADVADELYVLLRECGSSPVRALARVLQIGGRVDEAVDLLRVARNLDPNDAQLEKQLRALQSP